VTPKNTAYTKDSRLIEFTHLNTSGGGCLGASARSRACESKAPATVNRRMMLLAMEPRSWCMVRPFAIRSQSHRPRIKEKSPRKEASEAKIKMQSRLPVLETIPTSYPSIG
jgi:hypothetical protein